MPKIYGDVKFNLKTGKLKCHECNYIWEPSQVELNEIKLKHRITCICCRAMNELVPGQVIPRNRRYTLVESISSRVSSADDIRGNAYRDVRVKVTDSRCQRSFDIKLIQLRQGDIECPYCLKAKKIQYRPDISVNRAMGGLSRVRGETPLTEIEEKVDKPEKTRYVATNDTHVDIGKVLKSGGRVMEVSKELNTYTLQCTWCGTEVTLNLSRMAKDSKKLRFTVCERCRKYKPTVEELRRQYVGKVYNGLVIDDVYVSTYVDEDTDEDADNAIAEDSQVDSTDDVEQQVHDLNEIIVCDVSCLQNKKNVSLKNYLITLKESASAKSKNQHMSVSSAPRDVIHTQKGVLLGDVINYRCSCKVCSSISISNSHRLRDRMSTCVMRDTLVRTYERVPVIKLDDLTVGDFYSRLKTGSICDNCSMKSQCKMAGKLPQNSYGFISSAQDMEDGLTSQMVDIMTDYPAMLSFRDIKPGDIKPLPNKDLIIFRDLFFDRNGNLVKACKCMKHGTELSITDAEIEAFDHKQCMEPNVYMRFYNLPKSVYLNRPK